MTVLEKVQLICVEQGKTAKEAYANHNKFWNATLHDDHSVFVEWGRVGKTAQSQTKSFNGESAARTFIEKKMREKDKKGYEKCDIVSDAPVVSSGSTSKAVNSSELNKIAKQQIKHTNPVVAKLIDYLAKENAHTILEATNGAITYNDTTGLFSTPLGIVGQSNLDQANEILIDVGDIVAAGSKKKKKLMDLSQQYLRYIPTDIGMKRFDPAVFWANLTAVQAQKAIVDSLQASLVTATTATPDKDDAKDIVTPDAPKVFDAQLDIVEDGKVVDRIRKFFRKTRKDMHTCRHLDVKKVYTVDINTVRSAYQNDGSKMNNIWDLWHGTMKGNVLSILKGGLVIPSASSSHCTGRAFGNGVYASDISTKALGYAYGYWSGNKSENCFMFLLKMAMGRTYEPSHTFNGGCKSGYDSTFAKGGPSEIFQNNEMIVYRTSQIDLQYLVEFSPKGK